MRPSPLLAALALAACTDSAPLLSPPQGPAPPAAAGSVECTVAVPAAAVRCGTPAPGGGALGDLIVGGQGTYVQLASDGAAYDSAAGMFRMQVTLQNLLGQPVGTEDGVTPAGIRVFLDGDPATVEGAGTVALQNPDGTGFFTGSGQPFFTYPEVLAPYERSAPRAWDWSVPPGAARFRFRVYVAAAVPNRQGVLRWTRDRGGVAARTLSAVWGTGPSDVWAAGDRTMMYGNGVRWVVIPGDWTAGVQAIHGTAADDVWAAGGVLRHYDGRRWNDVPGPPGVGFSGVWALGRTEVWFAASGGMVLRRRGAAWDTVLAPAAGRAVSAVWAAGPDAVFAAGWRSRPYPQEPDGYVWRWDGAGWDSTAFPALHLRAVWGSSAADVYASGAAGALFRFDGSAWTRVAEGLTDLPLNRVWGSGAGDVWAVGGGYRGAGAGQALALHFDGTAWREVETGGAAAATGVFAPNPDQVVVVGYRGMVQKRSGGTWAAESHGRDEIAWSLWPAGGDDVYAARCGGVLRNGLSGWAAPLATDDCIFELWGTADGAELFAAGQAAGGTGGVVHRWDGAAWTRFELPQARQLDGLWGLSATEVYAVGYGEADGQQVPVVLRWDGTAWSELPTGMPWGQLRAVWGTASDDLYAVGTHVLHFDGVRWSSLAIHPSGDAYEDVWGTSPDDVYVVGGRVYHFDGAAWTGFSPRTGFRARAVWGSGPGDVYVVGNENLHFNGSAWTVPNIETSADLWDVTGVSARRVWAGGDGGVVVSGRR